MSLASGFQILIQFKMLSSGLASVRIWMDAKASHGNANLRPRKSTSWTLPFPLSTTKLRQISMRKISICTCTYQSHPRGVFTGLISGQVLRIRRLCSNQSNAATNIRNFQARLLARGHIPSNLNPLFKRAEENAQEYLAKSPAEHEEARRLKQAEAQQQIYFHLQYHPEDPPSREIQKLWRDYVSHPADDLPLIEKRNVMGEKVGIRKLIVAYSRPPNLRNRFSVRDIHGRGSNVSSFIKWIRYFPFSLLGGKTCPSLPPSKEKRISQNSLFFLFSFSSFLQTVEDLTMTHLWHWYQP